MGRTVLPFSEVLAEKQQQFSKFRRALREEDQHAFDALFEQARLNIQAAVYYSNPDPAEAFFLSVLIEHWKAYDELVKKLADLEARVEALQQSHGDPS